MQRSNQRYTPVYSPGGGSGVIDHSVPTEAPLWRNAASASVCRRMPSPGVTPTPPSQSLANVHHHHHNPATVSFQQSLRSYPAPSPIVIPTAASSSKIGLRKSQSIPAQTNISHRTAEPKLTPHNDNQERCYVTNLDSGQHSGAFYLDYLQWTAANEQTVGSGGVNVSNGTIDHSTPFDHRKFMKMFRENPQQQHSFPESGTLVPTSVQDGTDATLDTNGADNSLPYSVNDDSLLPSMRSGGGPAVAVPSTAPVMRRKQPTNSTTGTGKNANRARTILSRRSMPPNCYYLSTDDTNRKANIHNKTESNQTAAAAASGGGTKDTLLIQRKNLLKTMESKKTYDSANSANNQRVLFAGERRDAHIDHNAKRGNTNPFGHTVAFGSTRPRNIDLTRPLVTPFPTTRPKSEIFTGTLFSAGGSSAVATDSAPATPAVVYAKDDANYKSSNSQRSQVVSSAPPVTHAQSASSVQYSPANNHHHHHQPTIRAVRRHDPELVPALQKYIFRDFAGPSSNSPSGAGSHSFSGLRHKENSMISSMTSTKSFQTRQNLPFNQQSRPKKSFSMNRLDQLAQPRRRVESRVPNSASFVKPKLNNVAANSGRTIKSAVIDSDAYSKCGSGGVSAQQKPTPPPKNFVKNSTKSVPNESGGSSSRSAGTPKQRPLSQIEPLESSALESPSDDKSAPNESSPSAEEAEKLAEYKRQLAEKRAQYRRMQEQKRQQKEEEQQQKQQATNNNTDSNEASTPRSVRPISVKAGRNRPLSAIILPTKSLEEETREALEQQQQSTIAVSGAGQTQPQSTPSSSTSSSSSSSSDSEADSSKPSLDSENGQKTSDQAKALADNLQTLQIDDSNSPSSTVESKSLDSASVMTASCDPSTGFGGSSDAVAANVHLPSSMTASFDGSLLSSSKSPAPSTLSATNNVSTSSLAISAEQRKSLRLSHEIERQQRKNRIQEILKRTRKEEKKKADEERKASQGANVDDDANENNNDEADADDEGSVEKEQKSIESPQQQPLAAQSSASSSSSVENSLENNDETASSLEQNTEIMLVTANGGHKLNGLQNGDATTTTPTTTETHHHNGLHSNNNSNNNSNIINNNSMNMNQNGEMKNFANEHSQPLDQPTNGF